MNTTKLVTRAFHVFAKSQAMRMVTLNAGFFRNYLADCAGKRLTRESAGLRLSLSCHSDFRDLDIPRFASNQITVVAIFNQTDRKRGWWKSRFKNGLRLMAIGKVEMRTPEFIQLLTSNQSRLYGYILSLTFDPDQANDVLQQTNQILWQKEEDFEIGTNFIAWSFRIAYFQVLAHRKRIQRDRLVFDEDVLRDIADVPSSSDETFEIRQRLLRHCLEKLTEHQRQFVRLRYSKGLKLDAIATETDRNVNAVKQILFRARAALMACVSDCLPEEAK
ncbi:ECF RNA polymerase sigma factor SigK [Rubripirellula obstinata]|uniref:ECF RNA polymerase sigma factor SigK n=1 Tax=Rubripirellula obstinata TaxID=406547 RepID=A0A5B1CKJ5_9BACT|nr:sigma-70 family RNA polymerase sigma factor [Rubripirellula obstinata]KAA1260249.1 ECF RNA polymerase sigma factor SigK [Rubripirellula obstinata]